MHGSLIPEHAQTYLHALPAPICPIFDFHMHLWRAPTNDLYKQVAQQYGVVGALGMMHDTTPEAIQERFGDFYQTVAWPAMPTPDADTSWGEAQAQAVRALHARGVRALKFRSSPKHGRPAVWLDHPALEPVWEVASELRMPVVVHIADPSLWWPEVYDPAIVGDKEDYLAPVIHVIREFPELVVVGAHMAGIPEEPQMLSRLLNAYPNFYVDISATKWIVRELSRTPTRARQLFENWSSRILFGTDLVPMVSHTHPDYYASRFWTLRTLLEGDEPLPSMIADPDATAPHFPDGPLIRPLHLDAHKLRRIYWENAAGLLGLEEA